MRHPRILAAAALGLLLLILIVQNSEVVTVRLFFWPVRISMVVLLLLTAVIGFAAGLLVARLAHTVKRR